MSSQWSDEEVIDRANEAYDEMWRRYRLARKKWGLLTLKETDAAFTRDGETYDPGIKLFIDRSNDKITLPPDFGELVRIICLNNRSIRCMPSEMESFHWIDREQAAFDLTGNSLLLNTPDALIIYYDIIATRTLFFVPPVEGRLEFQIDYIPIKRPMYVSTAGTVAQSGIALTGTGTTWVDDNIFTEDTGNAAELISGTSSLTSTTISLNKDYPRVASIASNTSATMVLSATISAGTAAILAMAPALPKDTHRWLADFTSALMLKKINPELAEKYGADVMKRFEESIRPAAGRRQSQESPITEDAEEMGVTAAF